MASGRVSQPIAHRAAQAAAFIGRRGNGRARCHARPFQRIRPGRAPGRSMLSLPESGKSESVLRLVDQLVLRDPRHHGAQLGAHFLDRMGGAAGAGGLERRPGRPCSPAPSRARICPVWMSSSTRFISALVSARDDARAGDVFAIFGGVGDRIIHVGDAAFIDQVDDQLHFVQAFEIGHLRRIAGFDQGFEAGADQLDQAAAQHRPARRTDRFRIPRGSWSR